MKIFFLINFLISMGIFVFLSVSFFKPQKNSKVTRVINYFSIVGLLYLALSVFSIFWFMDFFQYGEADFLFIYALVIAVQSFIFLRVIYLFVNN